MAAVMTTTTMRSATMMAAIAAVPMWIRLSVPSASAKILVFPRLLAVLG